jgi:G3E family GTPase
MTIANIITGSFGAGKTTAIRWLMSHKQLREILRTLKPTRLLIEPSGAGHAAAAWKSFLA